MDSPELPGDLLRCISSHLRSLSDSLRFRSVSRSFRSAAASPAASLPFFISSDSAAGDIRLFSLYSGEVFTVHVPASRDKRIVGSSQDYLILSKWRSGVFELINPISDKQIDLDFLDLKRPSAVWIGPDPIRSYEYIVAIHGNKVKPKTQIMIFDRFVNNVKKKVTIEGGSCRACFCNGLFFSLKLISKKLEVFDIETQSLKCVISPPETEGRFFPPGASTYIIVLNGEILRVLQHYDKFLPVEQCKFDIHKLDFGNEGQNQNPFWVKIESIGDQMLFLDALNGFSVSASCFEGFRGNCIYFLKEMDQGNECFSSYTLCKYDVKDQRAEPLACPFVKGGTWFVPSL